ncbi:hypothetical protein ILUMI_20057 [Ignelater luminosus]|uniref:Uncharacterized protein n=1 Tax=Ignelater luminosus TaxID=2038154 RepID=A0A8K0CI40_IGNLU|nr:hypothetical protein ILUMI_20057 [Ignelater luminosus]
MRSAFLRKYKVILLDGIWIYCKGNGRRSWQEASSRDVKRPIGYEGNRFIVVHAGEKHGFVEGRKDDHAVLNMCDESLQQITPDIWKNCVRHTNTIIED